MKFDLLVQNIKSPDACGYKLLQIALLLDMPVILLLDEDDLVFTMRALATGVLLCITKPVPVKIAENIWQLVAREKMCKEKEMGRFREPPIPKRLHNGVREDLVKGCSSGNTSLDESLVLKKKMKFSDNANQRDNTVVFKRWIDWTPELHERFVYAVRKLGDGRCYPKDILEMMNVPGLTRMQVASHLQKCRRGTWIRPVKRKPNITAPMPTSGNTSNAAKSTRNGSMPPLIFNPQLVSDALKNIENDQDQVPTMDSSKGDNILGSGSDGLSQEGYNPFSDAGVEATNMEQVFDMDGFFMHEETCVIDAQSVTPADQSSVTDEFFEFPNVDIMIQNFCTSEQVPMDDQVYSNENEVPVVLDMEKDKCGEMEKTEEYYGETEGMKFEE